MADLAEAQAAATEFGYPVILKPTMGAGSYYVFKIDNPAQLAERFPDAVEGISHMSGVLSDARGWTSARTAC